MLTDSAGVHLGAGAFLLAYSLAEEKAEGEAEETSKWPRKYRVRIYLLLTVVHRRLTFDTAQNSKRKRLFPISPAF